MIDTISMYGQQLYAALSTSSTVQFLVWALLGLIIVNAVVILAIRLVAQAEDGDLTNGMTLVDAAMAVGTLAMTAIFIQVGLSHGHLGENWLAYGVFIGTVQLGGLIYRIRGGWLGQFIPGGTFPVRMIWSVSVAALLVCLWKQMIPELQEVGVTEPSVAGITCVSVWVAVMAYLGLMIPHGRQMDLGRCNGVYLEDAWHLSSIGALRLLMLITPLAIYDAHLLWVVWVGLFHYVAYGLGWILMVPTAWANPPDGGRSERYMIDGNTAWGEYLWGQFQTYGVLSVIGLSGYGISLFWVQIF